MSEKIERGDEVKCQVTGFQGVAVAIGQYLFGVPRVSVQPPCAPDGKIPEAYDIDITSLKVITKAKVPAMARVENAGNAQLGDEVVDMLTKFKGTVTAECVHLNGCVQVSVQGPVKKDNDYGSRITFDVARLEVVKRAKKAEKTEAPRKTGGPMSRSEARCV